MPSDRLLELIRSADADAPPPHLSGDLSARIALQARRTRARVALVSAVAAALVLAVSVPMALRHRVAIHPRINVTPDAAALEREADTRLAIARHVADSLGRKERIDALQAVAARPDPVRRAQLAMDEAALTLLQQGDHLYRDLGLKRPAADSYRQTAQIFPESRWAPVARQRLVEMETQKGETP